MGAGATTEVPAARRFRKVLIANRGEVAVRVLRACRELGIATVAVYSDADRRSLHVSLADEAVHVGGSRAAESYLDATRLVEAARRTGADAVHPGFGFLAENAGFADSVRAAGVEFIGPSAAAMRLMGSKAAARQFVRDLGIPVVPGDDDADQSIARLAEAAARVGYPVMIKAAAGGGGTGIRIVRRAEDLAAQFTSARSEALSAFGDPRLLLEKYFETVRHVEVQLLADCHGHVLHCSDRECSVQRRRQKVVEEAPACLIDPVLRAQMAAAAVRIAAAAGYSSLGTVEFLVDEAAQRFYFLEMNTRLQVEHGVTELVTGLDLVKLQIEIAEGAPLSLRQDGIVVAGHAIECRLYAEDPQADFAPVTGRVSHWAVDPAPHVRIDTSITTGTEVSPYYDPMLAKVMAWAPDRDAALRTLRRAVASAEVAGLQTNQAFLLRVLDHAVFRAGRATTRFVELHRGELAVPTDGADCLRAMLVAALQRWRLQGAGAVHGLQERTYRVRVGARESGVRIRTLADERYLGVVDDREFDLEVLDTQGPHALRVSIDGHAARHAIIVCGDAADVTLPGAGSVRVEFLSRFWSAPKPDAGGSYRASMTGRVIEVLVEPGASVRAGDRLLTMESMKMEHAMLAGEDGVVTRLRAAPGEVVERGALLVEIEVAVAAGMPAGLET